MNAVVCCFGSYLIRRLYAQIIPFHNLAMSRETGELNEMTKVKKRQRETNIHSQPSARKSRKLSAEASPTSDERGREHESPRPPNKHTKKERKQNRSTRIHSLRKLLARGTLPSTVQQEKERELAALVHEQNKTVSKKEAKKTLEKYHYVRFLERRKAEKKLKRLQKQQDMHGDSADLSKRIHDMEVNRNYAIYAPLGEKYVSVFVSAEGGERSNDTDSPNTKEALKPATWYAVETAMLQGEAELVALRDGKTTGPARPTSDDDEVPQHYTKKSTMRLSEKRFNHEKPSQDQSRGHRKVSFNVDEDVDSPSDGDQIDGGFFER